jgi:translation elongation factor EF-Tu-like GTPase
MTDKPQENKSSDPNDPKDAVVSEKAPAAAKVERGKIHTGEAVEIIGIKEKAE